MGFFNIPDDIKKKADAAIDEALGNTPQQKRDAQAAAQRENIEWKLRENFGTTNLDFVLQNYAPKTYQLLVKAAAAAADKNE